MITRRGLKYFFYYAQIKRISRKTTAVKSIIILYKIPLNSLKNQKWHDGFTAAVDLLESDFDITLINTSTPDFWNSFEFSSLNSYDFIMVKSAWRSDIDLNLRRNHEKFNTPIGLMISGTLENPKLKEQLFYDVIWYETDWYINKIKRHPNKFHGFGIDTDVMKPQNGVRKVYDWIMVGAPKKYKRVDELIKKSGSKLFIGDLTNQDNYSKHLLSLLKEHQVKIVNFVAYEELTNYYNLSKKCLIPTTLHGGGERSVLEARACSLAIEINEENLKLKELTQSEIWNHHYYYKQLKKGVLSIKK